MMRCEKALNRQDAKVKIFVFSPAVYLRQGKEQIFEFFFASFAPLRFNLALRETHPFPKPFTPHMLAELASFADSSVSA